MAQQAQACDRLVSFLEVLCFYSVVLFCRTVTALHSGLTLCWSQVRELSTLLPSSLTSLQDMHNIHCHCKLYTLY